MSRLLRDLNKSHILFLLLDLLPLFHLRLPSFLQVPDRQECLDLHGFPKNKHCEDYKHAVMFNPPPPNQLVKI